MTEVVQVRDARARASQIRQGIHNYLETLAVIAVAFAEGDHLTLGYDSWQSYVDGEFSDVRLKLPAEFRLKAVHELRLVGMSARAISATTGLDRRTVEKDLQVVENTPREDPIIGSDGKAYKPTRRSAPKTDVTASKGQMEARSASVGPANPPPSAAAHPSADPDAELRERLQGRLYNFWSGITDVEPERVAEVADDELWNGLEAMRREVIVWTDAVFAVRRRSTMRLVESA